MTFAFLLNVIWDYISEYRQDNEKMEKYMSTMNRYLEVKEIDTSIALKVSNYLEYYLEQDKARDEELENTLINRLTPDIRKELIFSKLHIKKNYNFLKINLFF